MVFPFLPKPCPTSNPAKNCLIEIKNRWAQSAQSTPEGTASHVTTQCYNQDGEDIMLVSGIVATGSLVALLVVLFAAGVALAAVDKHFDANRQH